MGKTASKWDDKPSSGGYFNPSTQEAETGGSLEFEASLVYTVSTRIARATQRNQISENEEERKWREGRGIVKPLPIITLCVNALNISVKR